MEPESEPNNNDGRDKLVHRLISKESSHYTDYDSSDFSDYDGYYDNDGEVTAGEEGADIHSLLEEDMDRLRSIYGPEALTYRLFSIVDSIDVELLVQMQFLERDVAVAWKIKPEEPLVIRLHLSASHYMDGEVPKVEVFQPSQKEKFGIGSQMRKILEGFLFEQWKQLRNDVVRSQLQGKMTLVEPNTPDGKDSATGASGTYVDPQALAKIIEMGFSVEMGKNALIISRGNLDEAVTLLLTNPECCEQQEAAPKSCGKAHGKLRSGLQRTRSKESKATTSKLSLPSTDPGGTQRGASTEVTPSHSAFLWNIADRWSRLLGKTKSEKDAKDRPGLDQGFLVMVMRYLYQRLPTLNEFCVVCDQLHVFQNGGMLKPAVCSRELCVFAFMSLGVMSDAADDIATGADVVDLLIAMANAACRSPRREDVFEPFPTVINPEKTKEFALSPKKKDFNRAKSAIDSFMRMAEMTQLRGQDLKQDLDRRDILAYPLLQWIVTSNRSHIVKLPLEKQIARMRTSHQFLLLSSPPAKEAIFREAKAKHGSTYAFHGSPLENWHSIMRQGLMNASGTRYQRHGAAYGKGIYLSPKASVSQSYSGMSCNLNSSPRNQATKVQLPKGPIQWQTVSSMSSAASKPGSCTGVTAPRKPRRFLQSTNLTCIALCEVVTSKVLKKSGSIWVMPEPDHVCTRFFFVYEDGQIGDGQLDTTGAEFAREIDKALGSHSSL